MLLAGNLLIFALGILILGYSSDYLIKTSVKLARLLSLSAMVVGLIFVAFGTSLPEAAVSLTAAFKGHPDVALGNVIGSNIANIGLAWGLTGLFLPVKADPQIFKREIPLLIAVTLAVMLVSIDGVISRFDGMLFLAGFVLFCFYSFRKSPASGQKDEFELTGFLERTKSKIWVFAIFVLSLIALIISANMMLASGVNIAEYLGVKPWIIAMTMLAIGTSLPEIAVCLAAALRGISSISVGNIIGSNIFNILFVLGFAPIICPIPVDKSALGFEFPVLMFFALFGPLLLRIRYRISRFSAVVLIICYFAFIVMLFGR